MLKKIINKTIHTISLKSGIVPGYSTGIYDITEYEIRIHANTFTIQNVDQESKGEIVDNPEIKVSEKVASDKKGILNKSIVDDYLDRSSQTVLKRIEKDKDELSYDDFKLLHDYETLHKNRKKVIKKLIEVSI